MPIIAHLADVHIGTPFDSLPAEAGAQCRAAHMDALRQAIDRANDLGAAAVLIAGDLFDTPDAPLPLFGKTMEVLSRAHCPVLISPGNHDYLQPRGPYCTAALPQNVHVFSAPQLEPFELQDGTIVWGAAFCDMSARIPLCAPLDRARCNLLCVHAELQADNAYNPVRPAELAASGFDYAAFGHNHEFSGLLRAGDTTYACTGCFVGSGASEAGARGYLLGEVEKGRCELRFVPSCGVQFQTLAQDMTGIADDRALGRAVASRIPAGYEKTCLTLELSGERAYEADLAGLRRALAQVCVHAALRDRTTAAQDPWRYAESDDLRGAVTRRFRARFHGAQEDDVQAAELQALKIALAALDGTEIPV